MSMLDTYFKNSNIPKRYRNSITLRPSKADESAFTELKNIELAVTDFVNEGGNLYLWSNNVGNGKTTWATKIAKSYIEALESKPCANTCPVLFINVTSFLNEKKLAISNKALQPHINDIENKIMSAKLVVFDDIGVKDLSEYEMSNLYYWIDYRTSNMLSCIYTSNISPARLSDIMGARLGSRIVNYSIVKKITDGDHRVKGVSSEDNTASSS